MIIVLIAMYICLCNAITEGQLKACVQSGACTLEDLTVELGIGAGCGRCRPCAAEILEETCPPAAAPAIP